MDEYKSDDGKNRQVGSQWADMMMTLIDRVFKKQLYWPIKLSIPEGKILFAHVLTEL